MRCPVCTAEIDDASATCPVCMCPVGASSLTRALDADALTRKIDDEVSREMVDGLLTRAEPLNNLIREESLSSALETSELQGLLDRVGGVSGPVDDGLARLLPEELSSISIDGLSLAKLIDPSSGDLRALKTGFTLVRHRRYAEASEYWNLQRQRAEADVTKERLVFLLLVLDAFTWRLAGDRERLRVALERVNAHPYRQRLRGTSG